MSSVTVLVDDVTVCLRPVESEELPLVMELVRQVGWQKTREDVHDMYSGDPRSLWGAFTDDGRLISTIAGVAADERTLFVGLYMSDPAYQGKGIGTKLTQYYIKLNLGKVLVGNSVMAMVSKYHQFGFIQRDEDLMMTFNIPKKALASAREAPHGGTTSELVVRRVTAYNIEDVLCYDATLSRFKRRDFLRRWLLSHSALTMRASLQGHVCGYVCVRRIDTPAPWITCFYSDDLVVATQLLRHVVELDVTGGKDLDVMYNSNNTENVAALVCDRMGLCDRQYFDQKSRPYSARLSLGAENLTNVDWQKVYAVGPSDRCVM